MRTLLVLPVIRLALDVPRWTPKKEIIIMIKSVALEGIEPQSAAWKSSA
jgi:hypothetical protein